MSAALAAAASVPDTQPLHSISVLVRNQPGVLVRVALVFARRGYNIESLVVSPDPTDAGFSRMTITCSGDPTTLDQIIKQLFKLVDVVRAIDHTGDPRANARRAHQADFPRASAHRRLAITPFATWGRRLNATDSRQIETVRRSTPRALHEEQLPLRPRVCPVPRRDL